MNYLGYEGNIKTEDYSKTVTYDGEHACITSNVIATKVTVEAFGLKNLSPEKIAEDMMAFGAWWMTNIAPNLNGYTLSPEITIKDVEQ